MPEPASRTGCHSREAKVVFIIPMNEPLRQTSFPNHWHCGHSHLTKRPFLSLDKLKIQTCNLLPDKYLERPRFFVIP